MRIIAGTHRGRPLLPPRDAATTRPITDRVKEALFNRLLSLGLLGEGRVLDVFCGTGSLGLEALSRGAEHCTFVDQDRDAVRRLEENLAALGLADRADVKPTNARSSVWTLALGAESVALAFLDPPYAMVTDDPAAMDALSAALLPKLEPGGVVVLRTPTGADARELDGYDGPASFRYGGMTLHFYQRPMDDGP